MITRTLLLAAVVAAMVRPGVATADGPAEPELVDYVVQPGDTCMGIAGRVLGDRRRYPLIHKYNPRLGKLPHRLKPGSILRLPDPRELIQPDANLTAKRGPVEVQKATDNAWDQARRGMDLFRAWKVNSHERATAEITFRDHSLIQMRANTLVVIYGPTSRRARRQTHSAALERGGLRTRLGELTGQQGVAVVTPSAEAELGQGSALITVDDAGTSRVANHAGKPVVVRSRTKRRDRVVVKRGMGSKVLRNQPPSKPQPLPPTPGWAATTATRFPGTVDGGSIDGAWAAVTGAVSYRVEIVQVDTAETIAAVVVPAAVSRFEAHHLPAGSYHVTVAAIDSDGFEGIASPPRRFDVVSYAILPPGQAALAAPEPLDDNTVPAVDTPPKPRRYLIGTMIVAPANLRCSVDDGRPLTQVILDQPGRHAVSCIDEAGAALAPLAVEVAAVTARVVGPAPVLARDRTTTVAFHLDSDLPLPPAMTARGPAGVALGELVLAPDGSAELAMTPDADSPERLEISLTAGAGDQQVTLASVTLAVASASSGQAPADDLRLVAVAAATPEPRFELGVFAGFDHFGDDTELGNAYEDDEIPESSAELGVRVGYRPHPRLTVEVEARLSPTRLAASNSSATVLGWRAHAMTTLPGLARYHPFLLLGLGGETLFSDSARTDSPDTDGAVYWGAGFRHQLSSRTGTRVDLRHRLTPGRDHSVTSGFEIQLAYFHRFDW